MSQASTVQQLRHLWEDFRQRLRRRGRKAALRALRLTGAAVAAYVVALTFSPPEILPLLAPLTALLVVQVTLASTLSSGVERIVSVVAGVLLAVLFSAVVGLTWWSLGALIAVSIALGQLLKLGPNVLEVPISAMLVLGVGIGATESAALDRIGETIVGALVGALVNLVWPPAVKQLDAGEAVERMAARLGRLLDSAARELAAGPSQEQATRWLQDAREVSRAVIRLDGVVADAEESRKLNVRAIGTPRAGATLRDGLEALEHTSISVRSMFRAILDQVSQAPPEGEYAAEVRRAFAVLLTDLGSAIRAFGRLVRAEVEHDTRREEAELVAALAALQEARARVTDLLLVDPRDRRDYWELNSFVLVTVERVLRELDVGDHVRLQQRRESTDRTVAEATVERIRQTSRTLAELTDLTPRKKVFPEHPFDTPTPPQRPGPPQA